MLKKQPIKTVKIKPTKQVKKPAVKQGRKKTVKMVKKPVANKNIKPRTRCAKTVPKQAKKPVVKTITKNKPKPTTNKASKVRAGDTHTINSFITKGHKGLLRNKKKNGKIDALILTHSPKTRGRKNIPLTNNPQQGKREQSYLVKKKTTINYKSKQAKAIGKKHGDVKVKNPVDKSIVRHLAKRK